MRITIIIAMISVLMLITGCAEAPDRAPDQPQQKQIGGDKDEHGCLPAAGYQWCPSTQACQRMWEEYCEEYKDQFRGKEVSSFNECIAAGYPAMESYPRQCRAQGKTFTEEIKSKKLTMEEAKEIAESSNCMKEGALKGAGTYNENTFTWWFDLDRVEEGCSPACVVDEKTLGANMNWRCTGLKQT
ncbi:hypothetical protein ACFL3V_06435 [Nanoarchaeota archaeon]